MRLTDCESGTPPCTGVEFCFVQRPVYAAFLNKVLHIAGQIESGTLSGQVGSMTMESQVKILEGQIEDAVAKGARVQCGGRRGQNGGGLFFGPTVITEIRPGMKIQRPKASMTARAASKLYT